ncbi:MAG: aminotransferase class I/II-fold pyridoxal phosphate-dependent enzyme, partial [Nitrospira sp.]
VELRQDSDFFEDLTRAYRQTMPRPRVLIINFPHNPTTAVVDLEFFKKIVAFAKEHNVIVIHDLAYADLVFDGYRAPSLLQVPEAKDIGVEFYTLSKSYNMPGWRVGFCVGNREVIGALAKIKSYLDYGIFQPVQIASIIALNGPQDCVKETVHRYQRRRDVLVDGLNRAG